MKASFAGLGALALAASPLAAIPLAVPFETAQARDAGQQAVSDITRNVHDTARTAYAALAISR